ncbi:hypothetical protein TWF694_000490 [Orbilia ellipsospora]|uniref:Uncharacterized protein n=1 Tax=Orbilia ellipsospora TaxID=2528407 RepID=A0AAV9XNU7_9PEZI
MLRMRSKDDLFLSTDITIFNPIKRPRKRQFCAWNEQARYQSECHFIESTSHEDKRQGEELSNHTREHDVVINKHDGDNTAVSLRELCRTVRMRENGGLGLLTIAGLMDKDEEVVERGYYQLISEPILPEGLTNAVFSDVGTWVACNAESENEDTVGCIDDKARRFGDQNAFTKPSTDVSSLFHRQLYPQDLDINSTSSPTSNCINTTLTKIRSTDSVDEQHNMTGRSRFPAMQKSPKTRASTSSIASLPGPLTRAMKRSAVEAGILSDGRNRRSKRLRGETVDQSSSLTLPKNLSRGWHVAKAKIMDSVATPESELRSSTSLNDGQKEVLPTLEESLQSTKDSIPSGADVTPRPDAASKGINEVSINLVNNNIELFVSDKVEEPQSAGIPLSPISETKQGPRESNIDSVTLIGAEVSVPLGPFGTEFEILKQHYGPSAQEPEEVIKAPVVTEIPEAISTPVEPEIPEQHEKSANHSNIEPVEERESNTKPRQEQKYFVPKPANTQDNNRLCFALKPLLLTREEMSRFIDPRFLTRFNPALRKLPST